MSDNEIIALLESDPSEGIRIIVDLYSSLVYTITYSKLGSVFSSDDIEEFVSYIFSCVYSRRTEIDFSRGSLKGYIATVAKRLCIDEYRKLQSRVKTVGISDEFTELVADVRNIQEDVEQRMDEAELVKALQRLNKADRMVIVKRYYYNQTAAEIAREMNITNAAARKRISRAMEKVKKILQSNTLT